jgi:hypothetical protein
MFVAEAQGAPPNTAPKYNVNDVSRSVWSQALGGQQEGFYFDFQPGLFA